MTHGLDHRFKLVTSWLLTDVVDECEDICDFCDLLVLARHCSEELLDPGCQQLL